MMMTAENEFHDLIAKLQAWFRAEAAASTLDALMDHFCTDFSMVGIAGQRLDREALAGMFAGGHGARACVSKSMPCSSLRCRHRWQCCATVKGGALLKVGWPGVKHWPCCGRKTAVGVGWRCMSNGSLIG